MGASAWYARGQRYGELSRRAFEQLLRIAPESGFTLALIGEAKSKDHKYTAALYGFREAARRMPRLRGVQPAIAAIDRQLGDEAGAAEAEANERKLGAPDCSQEIFYCDFSAGRFEDVVKAARLERTPESWYWLCRAYNELSVKDFEELGRLPESAELHKVKGQILREQNRYRESADEWRAAVKLAPRDAEARRELAAAIYLGGDYRTALPELRGFLASDPASADLNFFVGDSLLQTGKMREAVAFLETALRANAGLLPAHASLGLCYARLGDPRKAIAHLKRAMSLDTDGSLHYQLARAYSATGQPALARTMMAAYQRLRKPLSVTAPAP